MYQLIHDDDNIRSIEFAQNFIMSKEMIRNSYNYFYECTFFCRTKGTNRTVGYEVQSDHNKTTKLRKTLFFGYCMAAFSLKEIMLLYFFKKKNITRRSHKSTHRYYKFLRHRSYLEVIIVQRYGAPTHFRLCTEKSRPEALKFSGTGRAGPIPMEFPFATFHSL